VDNSCIFVGLCVYVLNHGGQCVVERVRMEEEMTSVVGSEENNSEDLVSVATETEVNGIDCSSNEIHGFMLEQGEGLIVLGMKFTMPEPNNESCRYNHCNGSNVSIIFFCWECVLTVYFWESVLAAKNFFGFDF
jgi:hypothetical protein